MANVNVTIRRHNGTDWDYLYPKTDVSLISGIGTVGQNILAINEPGAVKYIRIDAANTVTLRDAADIASDFNAAAIGHTHTSDEISHSAVLLSNIIPAKADLVNGLVSTSQLPDFVFGGLKYLDSISTTETLANIRSTIFPGGNTSEQNAGSFLIASVDTSVSWVDEASGDIILAPGDEGDNTTPVLLEAGDWLVYTGFNTGTSRHEWAVVNNNTQVAEQGVVGIVQIADGLSTSRIQLDTDENDGLAVMNEATTRKVLREIYYASADPGGQEGDLWFQGSF